MNRKYFNLIIVRHHIFLKCVLFFVGIIIFTNFINIVAAHESNPQNTHINNSKRELSKGTKDTLRMLTDREIKHLETYIKRISDKSVKLDIRQGIIKDALTLFLNKGENTKVESTTLESKTPKSFKTKEYFWNLATINFAKVEIIFAKTFFISDLKLGPDGKYYGNVSLEQTFIGTPKSKEFSPYKDVTKKNIQVIVEKVNDVTATKIIPHWKIFFGDIKVTETR